MDLSRDRQHVLEHTDGLWEPLRQRRIFITGGTGFFGTWLLQSLLWANEEYRLGTQVVVLSRNWQAFAAKCPLLAGNPAVACHAGDVRTFAFPSGEFSHVIHAATEASAKLNEEDPLLMLDTIVEGTRHTLDFAQHCEAENFLLASSGAVYGRQPPELTHVPEDYVGAPDTMSPRCAYGEGKRMAEHLCALCARKSSMRTTIARGFAFVGPGLPLDIHFAIGNFIRDGLKGGPILVQGDGTPLRSYLYAADLAIWLWKILIRGTSCRPYNVGSEESVSIGELAHLVADCFPLRPEVRIRGVAVPGKLAEPYVPSTRRAQSELGLRENVSLRQGIERTIDYHQREAGGKAAS